jgi:hypothetical protein
VERLLRYCARPAFALERLQQIDAEHLVYESPKPGPGGHVSQIPTPLGLRDHLAALIPPPPADAGVRIRSAHRGSGGFPALRQERMAGFVGRRGGKRKFLFADGQTERRSLQDAG